MTEHQNTLSYFSNFNDSNFNKKQPREFNKLIDDSCALRERNYSNNKTLKFMTTTFRDIFDAKRDGNYFSIGIDDQLFVPSGLIDNYSNLLNGDNGNIMTNCNVRHDLGELPLPTMPARYQLYHGDTDKEDYMRDLIETNKQSCNPRDSHFDNRSFYLFEDCIEKPNA